MKKSLLIAMVSLAGAALLSGCSGDSGASATTAGGTTAAVKSQETEAENQPETPIDGKTTIIYGKAAGPYTVLFEEGIIPILTDWGYDFECYEFSDLLQNDTALNEGEIDVNVEQHNAYAENFNASQNGDLVTISPIPTVPAAIFSQLHEDLEAISDGAVIAVPNDASNTARAYALLQKAGFITLDSEKDLATVTQDDITENPYNIQFIEMDSNNIPRALDEFDYAVITGSIVYSSGIDASTALLQEDILPHLILQVTVKEANKDTKWAQDIVAAYHSDEFKAYMAENNDGLWYVPEELQ